MDPMPTPMRTPEELAEALTEEVFPCNPLPFLNALFHYVQRHHTESIKDPTARKLLLILIQQSWGQCATVNTLTEVEDILRKERVTYELFFIDFEVMQYEHEQREWAKSMIVARCCLPADLYGWWYTTMEGESFGPYIDKGAAVDAATLMTRPLSTGATP